MPSRGPSEWSNEAGKLVAHALRVWFQFGSNSPRVTGMHAEVALVGFVEITRRYIVVRVGGQLLGPTLGHLQAHGGRRAAGSCGPLIFLLDNIRR